MLLEYIKSYLPETVKVLYLFSNKCLGQNRYHHYQISSFLDWLWQVWWNNTLFSTMWTLILAKWHKFWSYKEKYTKTRESINSWWIWSYYRKLSKSFAVHKMKPEDFCNLKNGGQPTITELYCLNNHIGNKLQESQRFHFNHQTICF